MEATFSLSQEEFDDEKQGEYKANLAFACGGEVTASDITLEILPGSITVVASIRVTN